MPPKKKVKTTASTTPTATSSRPTRASTRKTAAAAAAAETELKSVNPAPAAVSPVPAQAYNTPASGKRKRPASTAITTITTIATDLSEDEEKEEEEEEEEKPTAPSKRASRAKTAKAPARRAAVPKNTVPAAVPDTTPDLAPSIRTAAPKRKAASSENTAATSPAKRTPMASLESWFEQYTNPETGCIDPGTAEQWMSDLGIHPEGVFFYLMLWMSQAATQMTISQGEFTKMMTLMKVKDNKGLLAALPKVMSDVRPICKPCNRQFKTFYLWCFTHFRPEGAKNLTVDVAAEIISTLLDADRYVKTWKPNGGSREFAPKGCTPGEFPHRDAFIEFITSEPRPVNVITKDQFDQFFEFNASVSWDLRGYSEEGAWPALLDNYVAWKKAKYPSMTPPYGAGDKKDETER